MVSLHLEWWLFLIYCANWRDCLDVDYQACGINWQASIYLHQTLSPHLALESTGEQLPV
jgi:hypothetical protein